MFGAKNNRDEAIGVSPNNLFASVNDLALRISYFRFNKPQECIGAMPIVPVGSQSNSSDYFESDDPDFLEALGNAVLPGDLPLDTKNAEDDSHHDASEDLEPLLPSTQPSLKRRYSAYRLSDDDEPPPDQAPRKDDSDDDIYGAAHFGDFREYMRRKRAKLQIQNAAISQTGDGLKSQIFKGIAIYVSGVQ